MACGTSGWLTWVSNPQKISSMVCMLRGCCGTERWGIRVVSHAYWERFLACHTIIVADLLGLLHMDICGPFSVQGPRLERYFTIILDDFPNDSAVQCLCTHDLAFQFYLSVEARWERQTGRLVRALRVDDAKELIEGRIGTHLTEWGIHIQQTTTYSH